MRANASTCSHAELDEATVLDAGYPDDLASRYRELRSRFSQITVLGGCCGTDHRHIQRIAELCVGDASNLRNPVVPSPERSAVSVDQVLVFTFTLFSRTGSLE
jgi:hypothetical protein